MTLAAEALLRPKSIAIVGATETGWSKRIFDNLAANGFPAKLYLVNPRRNELWGHKVHPDFAAIGEPVDLALTIIPSDAIAPTLTEAAQHGLKCALIYAAQFGEGGDAGGAARAQAVLALRDAYGMRIAGPNCMGSISVREKLLLYPTPRARVARPGSVGAVFQSGGTLQYWMQQATVRGLGFSYAITSGNEIDLDLAEYLDFFIADEHTKIIACLVEGIRRPAAFMAQAARALAAGKPIVLLKVGRSEGGKQAVSSHTGSLAGDDVVFDAMCRHYGIVRCPNLDQMVETCLAFEQGRLPRGPKIGIVTYSGGAKGLMLDYFSDEGAKLARFTAPTVARVATMIDPGLAVDNPLDVGATKGTRAREFTDIAKAVAADPEVDLLAVLGQLPSLPGEQPEVEPFASLKAATDKPVIVFGRLGQNVSEEARDYQAATGLPFLQGLPESVRAMQGMIGYAQARARGVASLPPARGRADELEGPSFEALLARHSLTPPRGGLAATAAEAARLAGDIGFPVALKVVSPQASHKTEIGGVALGLANGEAVQVAADTMARRLRDVHPDAVIDGFLVQEMVEGLEFIVGARMDPQFGPFLVLGLGGVTVEVLKDTALALLPVDETRVREMLASLRSAPLLGAFRGRPARDVAALARAAVGLSNLFLDQRERLTDIEVNPLIVLPEGCGVRAVDVRVMRK